MIRYMLLIIWKTWLWMRLFRTI